jgi:hypothetical protein
MIAERANARPAHAVSDFQNGAPPNPVSNKEPRWTFQSSPSRRVNRGYFAMRPKPPMRSMNKPIVMIRKSADVAVLFPT